MFDDLETRLKDNDRQSTTAFERWVIILSVLAISVLIFTGLYSGIRFLN